jgi:hypothetical protein
MHKFYIITKFYFKIKINIVFKLKFIIKNFKVKIIKKIYNKKKKYEKNIEELLKIGRHLANTELT